jgi:hypothetical protein
MKKIKIFSIVVIALLTLPLMGQQTTVYSDALQQFKKGKNHYDQGVFGMAQRSFDDYIKMAEPENEPNYDHQIKMAKFYKAHCAMILGQEDGESLMLTFVKQNSPDPIANKAIFELGECIQSQLNSLPC